MEHLATAPVVMRTRAVTASDSYAGFIN